MPEFKKVPINFKKNWFSASILHSFYDFCRSYTIGKTLFQQPKHLIQKLIKKSEINANLNWKMAKLNITVQSCGKFFTKRN